jgi:hypothetical protein
MSTLDALTRVQDSPPSNDAEKVVWIERSLLVLLFAGPLKRRFGSAECQPALAGEPSVGAAFFPMILAVHSIWA